MTHRIYTHKTLLGGILCRIVSQANGLTIVERIDNQRFEFRTGTDHFYICPIVSDGRKLIACDIDGTLLCNLHRADKMPTVTSPHDEWMSFVNASRNDPPIAYRIAMLHLLAPHNQLAYVTYRGKSSMELTRSTLAAIGAPSAPLHMRDEDDFRRAPEYKEWQIDRLLMAYHKQPSELVLIDDDHEVCAHIEAQFEGCQVINVPSHDASYCQRAGVPRPVALAHQEAAHRVAQISSQDRGAQA